MKSRITVVCLWMALSLLTAGSVSAASAPPPAAALSVTSDRLEMDDKNQVAHFIGHVAADNGRMRMTANRMTVFYDKKRKSGSGGVREVKAEGQVVILEERNKGKADVVIYHLEKRTLELIGKESDASVQRGDDLLTGKQILVNLDRDHRIGKVAVQGGENRRVTARITPSGLMLPTDASRKEKEPTPPPATKPAETAAPAKASEATAAEPEGRKRLVLESGKPAVVEGARETQAAPPPVVHNEIEPKETVATLKETVAGWKETVAGWKEKERVNGEAAPAQEEKRAEEDPAAQRSAMPTPKPRRRAQAESP
ncbi:MAG: hypothetical protein HQL96_02100 [Magnetococcales bacterium]|nr:hypothetical protein [Magnetococcales bacterium]